MENDRLTIIVNSCDKNEDLWDVFFQVLKKKWSDCPYKIILNTETKSYSFDGFDITCPCVCKKENGETEDLAWTDRFLRTLDSVTTKYTLFLLEDFFIENIVDNTKVENLLDRLDKIKNLGALYLMDIWNQYPNYYKKKVGLYKIHQCAIEYKITATAAIWKTKALRKLTPKGVSIWDFEEHFSSLRLICMQTRFYTISNRKTPDKNDYTFTLDFRKQITKGKWTQPAVNFLQQENIDVDCQKRGIITFFNDSPIAQPEIFNWRLNANMLLFALKKWYVAIKDTLTKTKKDKNTTNKN